MVPRSRSRLLPVTTAALALATAFVLGATLGGAPPRTSGAGQLGAGPVDAVPAAYTGSDVRPTRSCADLLEAYVERGVDQVGPQGWASAETIARTGWVTDLARPSSPSALPAAAAADGPATSRAVNGATGTNVQESGVDEPDSVKTDGRTLFRVADGDVTAYDVTGASVQRLGSLDLTRMDAAELLLAGDTLVVVGTRELAAEASTRVLLVDVREPAAPRVTRTLDYDTRLVTARLHDDVVRLVLAARLPALDFTSARVGRDVDSATRANQDLVRATELADWLPSVSVDDGEPRPLLGCDQVAVPDDPSGAGTVAIVGLDLAEGSAARVTGLAADTGLVYASTDRLYLAVGPAVPGVLLPETTIGCLDCRPVLPGGGDGQTRLYGYALQGADAVLTATGRVDGSIADRWSMDAADGILRVALGPTSRTGDANAVVTLAEDGDDLVEVGRLDGLGRGEQIQSMRWFDDLAMMVTFRQTDPLYAIDLSDPATPTLLGELELPGFSAYLHPLGTDRMIGVGEGPGPQGAWGAQLGLFDVTDLTSPRRIALTQYPPYTTANAAADPRQFTWLPDARTVLTVISDHRGSGTGYVSVVHLDDGAMSNRLVEVEQGSEVTAVRLVPLPDGRVVLVTGDDATFFALDA